MAAKKASGSQNRAAAKERVKKDVKEEKLRREGAALPDYLKDLDGLPPVPVGNPVAGVAWANDVALILLKKVLEDPVFDFPTRLRHASDLIAKVGMLHSKAHVQKRLADLAKDEDEEETEDAFQANPLAGVGPKGRGRKAQPEEPLHEPPASVPSGSDGSDPP